MLNHLTNNLIFFIILKYLYLVNLREILFSKIIVLLIKELGHYFTSI